MKRKLFLECGRRWLCWVLLVALCGQLLAGCGSTKLETPARTKVYDLSDGFTAGGEAEEGLRKIHENARMILYADLTTGEISVEDKQTGHTWYSNPVDRQEDGLASGFPKIALLSTITVVYTTELSVEMTCGGFMSSVRKDGLYYRLEEDGSVIFLFNFPNEGFTIPVRYAIEEDHFEASVLSDWVSEYGTNKIKTIDLLPFFGAGGMDQDGYMLVPDGSGALIYYNNGRLTASTYSVELYGFDNGTSDKVPGSITTALNSTKETENQYLPVFGVHQEDQGFLAIVTEGAARAGVNANVAGKYTQYNTVWPSYRYRTIGTVWQTDKDGKEVSSAVGDKKVERWQDFTVSYYFLPEGESEYYHMAAAYREYLTETGGLVSRVQDGENIPLYLELFGYLKKTKSLIGIPVERKISTTTVADAMELLDTLGQSGISNVVVKYNYWAKNSYYDQLPTKAAVDGKVGTAKEMLALQQRLEEQGGGLYLSADLLNVYKTGNGVGKYSGILRNVANSAQRQFEFDLDDRLVDRRYGMWYLLGPDKIPEKFEEFAQNLSGAGYTHFALDNAGEMLYSELCTGGAGRNQMAVVMRDAIADVAQASQGLMLTGANDYAAVQAAHIVRSPARNSGYDLEDVSIPFYQMVFHGYTAYSLGETNLSSNPAEMTLKSLEYGAYPLYSLIAENTDELVGSRMNRLYAANADDWMEYIAWQYSLINGVLGGLQQSTIMEHRIVSEDVRVVTYSNGARVYVNYGDENAQVDGIHLEAQGYALAQDGSVLASGTVQNAG